MPIIRPILDRDLDLEAIPTRLLQLAASSLGVAGSPADGHAAALREAVTQFQVGGAEFANLDAALTSHMVRLSEASSDTLAGETQQLAQDIAKGRAFLGEGPDLVDAASKNPVQPLPVAPPPAIGAPGTIAALQNRPNKG